MFTINVADKHKILSDLMNIFGKLHQKGFSAEQILNICHTFFKSEVEDNLDFCLKINKLESCASRSEIDEPTLHFKINVDFINKVLKIQKAVESIRELSSSIFTLDGEKVVLDSNTDILKGISNNEKPQHPSLPEPEINAEEVKTLPEEVEVPAEEPAQNTEIESEPEAQVAEEITTEIVTEPEPAAEIEVETEVAEEIPEVAEIEPEPEIAEVETESVSSDEIVETEITDNAENTENIEIALDSEIPEITEIAPENIENVEEIETNEDLSLDFPTAEEDLAPLPESENLDDLGDLGGSLEEALNFDMPTESTTPTENINESNEDILLEISDPTEEDLAALQEKLKQMEQQ